MATAIAPEPQCQHLSRTDVGGKAGRQVCDNCKQIFQDGFPVTVVPPVAVAPRTRGGGCAADHGH